MSEKAINPVSSGAARTVQPTPAAPAPGGRIGPDTGKISPVQQENIRALNLDKVVRDLNAQSKSVGRALRFQVDVLTGFSVIQVLDRDTGELIRQIPPEEVGALSASGGGVDLQLLDDLV